MSATDLHLYNLETYQCIAVLLIPMVAITLTKEQSSVLASADGPVIVHGIWGREVAVLTRTDDCHQKPLSITADELEVILGRMNDDPSKYPTTAEVIQRIKSRIP